MVPRFSQVKWLLMLVAFAVFVIGMCGQPHKASSNKDQPASKDDSGAHSVDSSSHYSYSQQAAASPEEKPFDWHAAVKRPEWWAIAIALVTLFLIFWQAWETRKAAQATERSTEIANKNFVSTFRPKVIVRSIFLETTKTEESAEGEWHLELLLVNVGDTVADIEPWDVKLYWLRKRDDSSLSRTSIFDKTIPESRLGAGESRLIILSIPDQFTFSVSFNMLANAATTGGEQYRQIVVPFCSGTIVYTDQNGCTRRTGFERSWVVREVGFVAPKKPDVEYQD